MTSTQSPAKMIAGCGTLFPTFSMPSSIFAVNPRFSAAASLTPWPRSA